MLISQEQNQDLKTELIHLKKEHLDDANLCQDCVHFVFVFALEIVPKASMCPQKCLMLHLRVTTTHITCPKDQGSHHFLQTSNRENPCF